MQSTENPLISAYGATIIDDADAEAARDTLELGTIATAPETNYLLASGSRAGATTGPQEFTNGIVTGGSGSITIGDVAAANGLLLLKTSSVHAPSLTSAGENILEASGGAISLACSVDSASPYGVWFQVRNNVLDGFSYPLLLNPSGGNVGIGTRDPQSMLDVDGMIRTNGLRIDVSPTAETITCTHTITISVDGTDYKIPCAAA